MKRFALLLFLAACGTPYKHNEQCAAGEFERDSQEFAEPRNDIPGLPNLARVSPALYRSAQPTAEGFAEAKKLGIKTILNIRWGSSDRDELKGLGLQYFHISFSALNPEDSDVIAFLQVVQDPANHPVLVHCQRGADRTGMMVAIYRHMVQGWPMVRAKKELPRFGFDPMFENLIDYLDCLNCPQMRERVKAAPPPKIEFIP